MWYVYFLQPKNDDIHVGSTGNLRNRVSLHQKGEVRSPKPIGRSF
jgi:predicted GIY-YIG superfamily endonuclease